MGGKKFKAPFIFSASLPKNNYSANPNSDFDSAWKDLLMYHNNLRCKSNCRNVKA